MTSKWHVFIQKQHPLQQKIYNIIFFYLRPGSSYLFNTVTTQQDSEIICPLLHRKETSKSSYEQISRARSSISIRTTLTDLQGPECVYANSNIFVMSGMCLRHRKLAFCSVTDRSRSLFATTQIYHELRLQIMKETNLINTKICDTMAAACES